MKTNKSKAIAFSVVSALTLIGCNQQELQTQIQTQTTAEATPPEKDGLVVWWQEGFYPEEIDALNQIISAWEAEVNVDIDLEVIPQKDILQEVENAIAEGDPPDILYAGVGDLTIFPRLAWENQLADVSNVVLPLKDKYGESALEGVNYQNKASGERSYYAVPLMQSAIHIHYWEDLLIDRVGERRETIPTNWEGFWQFWIQAQADLGPGETANLYSVGMPMSLSLDTYNNFEQFLEAHNVKVLDEDGRLNLNEPSVRQSLVLALEDYAQFYQAGTVPPKAVDWDNTGNNVSLLSRGSLMTVNHTLSAPGSQRDDAEVYYERLSTVKWPDKPNGDPMRFVIEIKQAVVFEASDKRAIAQTFLAHLAQPKNLAIYTKGSRGRYLPVMPELFADPFWQDPQDRHIEVALEQLENTRPAYQALNPAYGEVAAQNVWGETMRQVAVEGLSAEAAADRAITEIQRIFSEWQ